MIRRAMLTLLLCLSFSPVFADMQADRMAFIEKLIAKGVFQKVEIPGNLPRLWVRPAFYALDFNLKSKFVNVVYAYFITENPRYDIVVIYDSKTGKEVGKYADVYGGLKLE